MNPRMTRAQRSTILAGISAIVALLVTLQLWLLTATMNAWLGGDSSVVGPAAWASFGCLLINIWLLRQIYHLESAYDR